jgi:OOP family OmpA-OmpF porin
MRKRIATFIVLILTILLVSHFTSRISAANWSLERATVGDGRIILVNEGTPAAVVVLKCPNPPPGCILDKDGCPIDSDKDGVCDGLDKCPNTPEGAKVDKDGCTIWLSIRLNVEFDTNKAIVKPQYENDIKRVADFMNANPNMKATIEGHTDNVGSAQDNLDLSQRRADAVMKFLVDKYNISQARLTAIGYGLTRPIEDNATAEGRQKNRRVEVVLEAMEMNK